jgi:hypothetical protein
MKLVAAAWRDAPMHGDIPPALRRIKDAGIQARRPACLPSHSRRSRRRPPQSLPLLRPGPAPPPAPRAAAPGPAPPPAPRPGAPQIRRPPRPAAAGRWR